jgi:anti-sigma regulatory factor (Ser/Thr protein kinase)
MSQTKGRIRFSMNIASDPVEANHVRQTVMQAVDQFDFKAVDRFAIELSLDEALSNAMGHGNHHDHGKRVLIHVTVSPGHLVLRVADEGEGFAQDRATVGCGLRLMRSYMDHVQHNRLGNCVTMERLAAASA